MGDLSLRIISTWGSIHSVGLTELQVFDLNGQKIKLKATDFDLNWNASTKNIGNIINDNYKTINSKHMWTSTIPDSFEYLEVSIKIDIEEKIGSIKIWNYNSKDTLKGIK